MFEVKRNLCNCHPETCCCNDWAIFKSGIKHSTYFNKRVAEDVAEALNIREKLNPVEE